MHSNRIHLTVKASLFTSSNVGVRQPKKSMSEKYIYRGQPTEVESASGVNGVLIRIFYSDPNGTYLRNNAIKII